MLSICNPGTVESELEGTTTLSSCFYLVHVTIAILSIGSCYHYIAPPVNSVRKARDAPLLQPERSAFPHSGDRRWQHRSRVARHSGHSEKAPYIRVVFARLDRNISKSWQDYLFSNFTFGMTHTLSAICDATRSVKHCEASVRAMLKRQEESHDDSAVPELPTMMLLSTNQIYTMLFKHVIRITHPCHISSRQINLLFGPCDKNLKQATWTIHIWYTWIAC